MDPSHRALAVGLTALPVFPTASTASVMPDDPIFTAISHYRYACAELCTINERTNPARYAAAEVEVFASGAALVAVKPVTLAGATALAKFIVENDQDHWACEALKTTLSETLPQLTGSRAA